MQFMVRIMHSCRLAATTIDMCLNSRFIVPWKVLQRYFIFFQSFAHNTCIFTVCVVAAHPDLLRSVGTPVTDYSNERNNSEVSVIIISHCGSPIVYSTRR